MKTLALVFSLLILASCNPASEAPAEHFDFRITSMPEMPPDCGILHSYIKIDGTSEALGGSTTIYVSCPNQTLLTIPKGGNDCTVDADLKVLSDVFDIEFSGVGLIAKNIHCDGKLILDGSNPF